MNPAASAIGLALLLATLCVAAQPVASVPRVGYLGFPGEPAEKSLFLESFLAGLRDAGYRPGHDIVVEVRRYSADAQLRQAIAELATLKVKVLVVGPPGAATTAKQASKDVPIVCASCGDPVENGLAASLARPGGMVTGVASLSAELIGKRLAQLKDLIPGLKRVAVVLFPANPGTPATLKALDAAGRTLSLEIVRVEVRGAADIEPAFRAAADAKVSAVLLQDDPLLRTVGSQILAASLKHRLPASTGVPEVAEAGTLLAYGPNRFDMIRRTAAFADKILKGSKPGELPFEQVARLHLLVNMKTARALGLAIPPSIMLQADRVIE